MGAAGTLELRSSVRPRAISTDGGERYAIRLNACLITGITPREPSRKAGSDLQQRGRRQSERLHGSAGELELKDAELARLRKELEALTVNQVDSSP
jgi:GTP cyclohydrolase III